MAVLVLGEREVDAPFQEIARAVGLLFPYRDSWVELDLVHLGQGALDLEVVHQEVHSDHLESVASWLFLTVSSTNRNSQSLSSYCS